MKLSESCIIIKIEEICLTNLKMKIEINPQSGIQPILYLNQAVLSTK